MWSVCNMLAGLGALSVLVAVCLAGFGVVGARRQAAAMEDVMLLAQALHNHSQADTFMDGVRTDVLRALQATTANKEGAGAIRANFQHHVEVIEQSIAQNHAMALDPTIHGNYVNIARLAAPFVVEGRLAVELALTDPATGARNYEHFRHNFAELEDAMDATRDRLNAGVDAVRTVNKRTSALVQKAIVGAAMAGILLLVAVCAAATKAVRGIIADLANSREQAQHAALHDILTGLPNRTLLSERLD